MNRCHAPIRLVVLFLALAGPTVAWAEAPPTPEAPPTAPKFDGADTAWMLVSTGLVLLMVPGLALFYGGMVRRKNILGTMMHSMVAMGIIGVQWLLFGYCLAFGASQGGFIGWDPNYLGLSGVMPNELFPANKIPIYVHCMYQGMFAIITPALISGALAERIRFGPYCLFILLWSTLVYDPLAHWVWAIQANAKFEADPVGWLGKMGALDFAGGTVVHIAAGFSALAAILLLPRRRGYPEHAMHPNSMVLTLVGAGLLWFGWFGFNGGSALGASAQAGLAVTVSQIAAAGAAVSWLVAEWLHRGKPTALGLASGIVAGLVAITPAAGFVGPMSALYIGLIAGLVCYMAVSLKPRLKYDDSLDAFGVHGIGGFLGAILTGVFVSAAIVKGATDSTSSIDEFVKHGRTTQIVTQMVAAVVAAAYGFIVTVILVKAIDLLWGFRLSAEQENAGLDLAEHGEAGFDFSGATAEEGPESTMPEPRPARVPPEGKERFTVVVNGVSEKDLMVAWSKMCQAGVQHPPELLALYPLVTTVVGNRFRFRGGDRSDVRGNMKRLFEAVLHTTVQTHVEE